ncbi:hypothetical protein N7455_004476 [Penicillium solitum]|uniref:uncharacterized protein n=1 Tax=Penicillium solitum TaxID=60172 RepID=UPI0032C474EA|nr:hypothetical protein N7455_004476 [Penicillium solitum]
MSLHPGNLRYGKPMLFRRMATEALGAWGWAYTWDQVWECINVVHNPQFGGEIYGHAMQGYRGDERDAEEL